MLPSIFKTVTSMFLHNSNQFASGGLLLMLVGGIAVYLKAIPGQIYEKFLHLFSMTVTITDDSKAFLWFKWWFREHDRSKKIRHVDISTPRGPNGIETLFFPAPGSHWFWHKKRPFRLTFTRSEGDKAGIGRETRPESLVLRVVGREQKFLRGFIRDVKEKFDEANKDLPGVFIWNSLAQYWAPTNFSTRPLDSVILPLATKETLIDDILDFKKSKDWYKSTGIPYHRSYLLYGPPGTGKTSTLIGLANYFKMNIYIIKLINMNDDGLICALREATQGSMVVFEDVDCLNNKRKELADATRRKPIFKGPKPSRPAKDEPVKSSGLTLSGLLNALDGIETPSDILFFMTTNLIESLDEALIRPGRVDKRIYLGPATVEQKLEMYGRFFPSDSRNSGDVFVVNNPQATTMAEFQEQLKLKRSSL